MTDTTRRFRPTGPATTSRRGSFWVGIEPVQGSLGTCLRGPMYVHWEQPEDPSPGPPWILIHGGGGQGTDYLATPDGRLGWARLLVEQGHSVFVVDRPGHGRSPHHPEVLGPIGPQMGYEFLGPIFTPETPLHTQWPAGRDLDDSTFAQFLAPSGPMLADPAQMHALERDRLAELLELVGPAIVVTHSAGGPGTFAAVDAAPDRVAALIAIETIGPPFARRPEMGLDLTWGVTTAPLALDPPSASADALRAEPPPRLANLSRVPIAVVTAEASVFLEFDREQVAFLERGGCEVELIRLADHGVRGNSHGIMLERNNAQALAVLTGWAARRARPPA